MKRHNPKARPSKAAQDTYRRLMEGGKPDDFSRLEKDGIGLDGLPAIELDSLPELDLEPPDVDLSHNTGKEPRQ